MFEFNKNFEMAITSHIV